MRKLCIDPAALEGVRFRQLCRSVHAAESTAVGVLVLWWRDTRASGVTHGTREELQSCLPVLGAKQKAWFDALIATGYVTVEAEDNRFAISGNAEYVALMRKRADAASKGRMAQAKRGGHGFRRGRKQTSAAASTAPVQAVVAAAPKAPAASDGPSPFQLACRATWEAYREAYVARWEVEPARNAKVNACVQQIVQRLGMEFAAPVLAFYVEHNDSWYVRQHHSLTLACKDAEALYTQWRRGRTLTLADCTEIDRASHAVRQLEAIDAGRI